MRIFGLEITLAKPKMLSAVPSNGGWMGTIREPFGGAWQSAVQIDPPKSIVAFSGVFAPITLIAGDIAKLRLKLTSENEDGICYEVESGSPFLPVLRKPNPYQTRIQFIEQWVLSKLLFGNAYLLKVRDARRIVTRLYGLDPQRVTPLVADNGDVYYKLSADKLSGLQADVTIPASEIIHDRMNCLWHPLVGVSPLYACGQSATQGNRIQSNSTKFFDNMSRPSGMLVVPGTIDAETAAQYKSEWEKNYGGNNVGRTAVLGGGLKYEAIAYVHAQAAQLSEQWKITVDECAKVFHVPLFKVGGPIPVGTTVEALQQVYYTDCLQRIIEEIELCLDEGLALPEDYYTELDIEGLLRMDQAALVESEAEAVGAGIKAPNESRKRLNLPAVVGGDACYLQQQNFSIEALAKRDAQADPFGTSAANSGSSDSEDAEASAQFRIFMEELTNGLNV